MMKLREVLLDAKKTVGAAVAAAGTAAALGVISGPVAAEVAGVGGAVITALVYLLGNVAPVGDDTGPGTTGVDADLAAEIPAA